MNADCARRSAARRKTGGRIGPSDFCGAAAMFSPLRPFPGLVFVASSPTRDRRPSRSAALSASTRCVRVCTVCYCENCLHERDEHKRPGRGSPGPARTRGERSPRIINGRSGRLFTKSNAKTWPSMVMHGDRDALKIYISCIRKL